MLLPVGNYEAMIIDYGVGETKAGDPQILILFSVAHGGTTQELTWYGSLKEGKAREITMKALLTCGIKTDDLAQLVEGIPSNLLDAETPVSLVIDHEVNNGRTYVKVKFINRVGGASFRKLSPNPAVKNKLSALNLKGDMAAIRQSEGVPKPKKPEPAQNSGANFDDDIGF